MKKSKINRFQLNLIQNLHAVKGGNKSKKDYKCEDDCLKEKGSTLCGQTDHF